MVFKMAISTCKLIIKKVEISCNGRTHFRKILVDDGSNHIKSNVIYTVLGRLRGLAVACSTTDHSHEGSNPGVGISEGCFISDFTSLPLEVVRSI